LQHSLRALGIAIQIAKRFDGKITLIHVYSVGVRPIVMPEPTTLTPPSVPIMAPADFSKVVEAARKAGTTILTDGENRVKSEGFRLKLYSRKDTAFKRQLRLPKTVNSI